MDCMQFGNNPTYWFLSSIRDVTLESTRKSKRVNRYCYSLFTLFLPWTFKKKVVKMKGSCLTGCYSNLCPLCFNDLYKFSQPSNLTKPFYYLDSNPLAWSTPSPLIIRCYRLQPAFFKLVMFLCWQHVFWWSTYWWMTFDHWISVKISVNSLKSFWWLDPGFSRDFCSDPIIGVRVRPATHITLT